MINNISSVVLLKNIDSFMNMLQNNRDIDDSDKLSLYEFYTKMPFIINGDRPIHKFWLKIFSKWYEENETEINRYKKLLINKKRLIITIDFTLRTIKGIYVNSIIDKPILQNNYYGLSKLVNYKIDNRESYDGSNFGLYIIDRDDIYVKNFTKELIDIINKYNFKEESL